MLWYHHQRFLQECDVHIALFIDNEVNYSGSTFDLNSFQQPLDTFCWCFMLLDVAYPVDGVQAESRMTELG